MNGYCDCYIVVKIFRDHKFFVQLNNFEHILVNSIATISNKDDHNTYVSKHLLPKLILSYKCLSQFIKTSKLEKEDHPGQGLRDVCSTSFIK